MLAYFDFMFWFVCFSVLTFDNLLLYFVACCLRLFDFVGLLMLCDCGKLVAYFNLFLGFLMSLFAFKIVIDCAWIYFVFVF